jgi:hypothetical protein
VSDAFLPYVPRHTLGAKISDLHHHTASIILLNKSVLRRFEYTIRFNAKAQIQIISPENGPLNTA